MKKFRLNEAWSIGRAVEQAKPGKVIILALAVVVFLPCPADAECSNFMSVDESRNLASGRVFLSAEAEARPSLLSGTGSQNELDPPFAETTAIIEPNGTRTSPATRSTTMATASSSA